jgi:maltose phosphorylase
MLGVTGPNEYENNVNNNWYTNTIAAWTLEYSAKAVATVKKDNAARYQEIVKKTNFNEETEVKKWSDIVEKMY